MWHRSNEQESLESSYMVIYDSYDTMVQWEKEGHFSTWCRLENFVEKEGILTSVSHIHKNPFRVDFRFISFKKVETYFYDHSMQRCLQKDTKS